MNVPIVLLCVYFIASCLASSNAEMWKSDSRVKRATSPKPKNIQGTCGGSYSGFGGYIASPNFPEKYPSTSNCTYSIAVPSNFVVKIEFTYVDMENAPIQMMSDCGADSISIFDTNNPTTLVGGQKYCGYSVPFNPAYSKTNKVEIKFIADSSDQRFGFVLRWMATKPLVDTFDCDFESLNGVCRGWTNEDGYDFNWSVRKGPTPSGKRNVTGPQTDHTLETEDGTYIYIEGSGKTPGEKAAVSTAPKKLNKQNWCLTFWYHMKGEGMGTLFVYRKSSKINQLLYGISGPQKDVWHKAQISIKGDNKLFQVMFVGIRGNTYKSDIAIDDIQLNEETCETVQPTTKPKTTTVAPTTTIQTTTPTTVSTTLAPVTTVLPRSYTSKATTNTGVCAENEYRCRTSNLCISITFFCDGQQDCLENEDEDCPDGKRPDICEPWSSWTECSKSCGVGSRTQKRSCFISAEDAESKSVSMNDETCNSQPCPSWTDWNSWSDCSASCNGGLRSRNRTCTSETTAAGCSGPRAQTINCNGQNCPKWGLWSPWTPCPVTCGQSEVTRSRVCVNGEIGEQGCVGVTHEKATCIGNNRTTCGSVCYDGIITTSRGLLISNDFAPKKCSQGQENTGIYFSCGLILYKVQLKGSHMTVKQGACLPSTHCDSFACSELKTLFPEFKVIDCEAKCCSEDLCNDPTAKTAVTLDSLYPCSPNPCLNKGVCQPSGGENYLCFCADGFGGDKCQHEVLQLKCYTGFTTRLSPIPQKTRMTPTTCKTTPQTVCQTASIQAELNGQTAYLDATQCSSEVACNDKICDMIQKSQPSISIKKCKVSCCKKDFCNTVQVPIITTAAPEPTTMMLAPRRVIVCPKRNPSRWRGRVCAAPCSMDAECQDSMICTCDGACGKTCSDPETTCPPALVKTLASGLKVDCSAGQFVGSKCVFTCESGYQLLGLPNLNCQSDGKWDKVRQPRCLRKRKVCARRILSLARQRGRTCKAACRSSADCAQGLVCECDGPCGKTCSDPSITCPKLTRRPNSGITMKCSSGFRVGSKCAFACPTGDKMIGLPNRNCQSDGTWDKERTPYCQKKSPLNCQQNRPAHDKCCGRVSYNSKLVMCCNGRIIRPKPVRATSCCARIPYDPEVRGCCGSRLFNVQTHECCNGLLTTKNGAIQCCNGRTYNTATHTCVQKFGGRVIPIDLGPPSGSQEEEEEE